MGFFLKMLINSLKECYFKYNQHKLKVKFKTSKFHETSRIFNSDFKGYNTINENTTIETSIIGRHTYIQAKSTIVNCEIGNFCSIGNNVFISPGNHPTTWVSTHPCFYSKENIQKSFESLTFNNKSNKTSIGHDVWIGNSSIILDGCTIGTGAIIGAGSLVTKNVEPYTIVGGVPAKIIKHRFDHELSERILQTKWWNLPDKRIHELSLYFDNPELFLNQIESNQK